MAVRNRGELSSVSANPSLKCPECNANLGEKTDEHGAWHLRNAHQKIAHCDGSPCAYGAKEKAPHHTMFQWPDCWKCGLPLGCPKCSADVTTELLCEACLAWGTADALLQHGPISNDPAQLRKRAGKRAPTLAEYPPRWRTAYLADERPFFQDLDEMAGKTEHAKRMVDAFSSAIPERYAEIILRLWEQSR